MLLAIGGNAMHRTPSLFTLALTKKPVKNLKLCGAAPGLATDFPGRKI
jgi:acyl CoA:acetate/3-ketoacid CoA transferase alpha subunit